MAQTKHKPPRLVLRPPYKDGDESAFLLTLKTLIAVANRSVRCLCQILKTREGCFLVDRWNSAPLWLRVVRPLVAIETDDRVGKRKLRSSVFYSPFLSTPLLNYYRHHQLIFVILLSFFISSTCFLACSCSPSSSKILCFPALNTK